MEWLDVHHLATLVSHCMDYTHFLAGNLETRYTALHGFLSCTYTVIALFFKGLLIPNAIVVVDIPFFLKLDLFSLR
jgi:hypothetical protein